VCVPLVLTYACSCPVGYVGINCEIDLTATTTSTTTTTTVTVATTTTIPPVCGPVPATGCFLAQAAGASSLKMKDNPDDTKDQFGWKWGKGQATTLNDFADPVNGSATYRVCLYDASAQPQPLMQMNVPPGGTCGTKPCWKPLGTKGFLYKNRAATPHGLTILKLKAGIAGKSQVQTKGKGTPLPMPSLGLTLPATVQLVITDGVTSKCWQTTFTTAKKNDSTGVTAKGP
jgi:hypothetical protein